MSTNTFLSVVIKNKLFGRGTLRYMRQGRISKWWSRIGKTGSGIYKQKIASYFTGNFESSLIVYKHLPSWPCLPQHH